MFMQLTRVCKRAVYEKSSIKPLGPSDHFKYLKKKLKQSRNRPGVAQRVPGNLDSQIPITFCI